MPAKSKKGKKGKGRKQNQKGNKSNKNNRNTNHNNKNRNNKNTNEKRKENNKKRELFKIRGIHAISLEEYTLCGQTFPPSLRVSDIYLDKELPMSQTMPHPGKDSGFRMASDERKAIEDDLQWQQRLRDCREAAEVHRQVRQAAQLFIQPGLSMIEICEFIEGSSSHLVGYKKSNPMQRGWGFPTGCSLNECAAHYTPNPNDRTRLRAKDLCKIDFGVQINGHIIDCAFSMSFDSMHDSLMEAVKAATNRGIEVMGIDARLGEIGGEIQEVMESYEAMYDGQIYGVKSIRNLNGHSIAPWVIHGGKTVPIVKNGDNTKMVEGEMYAIETFGSVMGRGEVYSDGDCSHFALISDHNTNNGHYISHLGAKKLLKYINHRFGTIPFCRRWLNDDGQKRHLLSLKKLVEEQVVRAYPPLCELKGAYTAQYEHTILLRPTRKEVLSRGNDY